MMSVNGGLPHDQQALAPPPSITIPSTEADEAPLIVPASSIITPTRKSRPELRGAWLDEVEALRLINAHFIVGEEDCATALFRIRDDGSLRCISEDEFKLAVRDINVCKDPDEEDPEWRMAGAWWLRHKYRNRKTLVFKTTPLGKHEYNLWNGWGVIPTPGRALMTPLIDHIWVIICRRDQRKFDYLLNWLAWAVQNPDKAAEVAVLLLSRNHGAGKSLLSRLMRLIFGRHGRLVDDKDQMLGRFAEAVLGACFLQVEEAFLESGDKKAINRLKSIITADVVPTERKNGPQLERVNRLHIMMTSNHTHAVVLGPSDRRYFVLNVAEVRIGDRAYFKRLHTLLDAGGAGQFLDFLLKRPLGDFHPRDLYKTPEAYEQQRMSMDTIAAWLLACAEHDQLLGGKDRTALNDWHPFSALRDAYIAYCREEHPGRPPKATNMLGVELTALFGEPREPNADEVKRGLDVGRKTGYFVPDAKTIRERVYARNGIPTGELANG
jgi:hypothetical protein